MGLDIYAGTLTRYFSHNWKTVVQQWAEENGYSFNRITPVSYTHLDVYKRQLYSLYPTGRRSILRSAGAVERREIGRASCRERV